MGMIFCTWRIPCLHTCAHVATRTAIPRYVDSASAVDEGCRSDSTRGASRMNPEAMAAHRGEFAKGTHPHSDTWAFPPGHKGAPEHPHMDDSLCAHYTYVPDWSYSLPLSHAGALIWPLLLKFLFHWGRYATLSHAGRRAIL